MTDFSLKQQQKPQAPAYIPPQSNILQRKCACGRSITANGECAECRKKRMSLQRRAVNLSGPEVAPPIVHEVLRSPGRPLDPSTRSFMESRFNHDFGRVRVHTDQNASESAYAVNALAYTVGQNIVFRKGNYSPETIHGRELLAHELTHVFQQTANNPTPSNTNVEVARSDDRMENEATLASTQLENRETIQVKQSVQRPIVNRANGGPVRSHRFSSEGVSVVVRPSCAPANFGFATVEVATKSALDKIFNSNCIEESRRTRIQRNLTSHGLDIRCAASGSLQNAGACAESTGFSIPANIMTVGSKSFPSHPDSSAGCLPLASIILHEIIHLTRGVFPERLPDSCENSCFGVARGTPDLCRDIDVFGRRRPPVGDFPLPTGDTKFA
jgi:hypothetical protein